MALGTVVVVGGSAGIAIGYQFSRQIDAASASFHHVETAFNQSAAEAIQKGYTDQELAPVLTAEKEVVTAQPPIWPAERVRFYETRAQRLNGLQTQLGELQAQVLEDTRKDTQLALDQVRSDIVKGAALGLGDSDLNDFRAAAGQINDQIQKSSSLPELRALKAKALDLDSRLSPLLTTQQAEVDAINQAAAALKAQQQGNVDAIRKVAESALFNGRNDASTAGFMKLHTVDQPYGLMERYAAQLNGDVDHLAFAAAAIQRYSRQVHEQLMRSLPKRSIVVSLYAQELIGYEDGKVKIDSVITSGKPGTPTDVGLAKVLWKSSPWTMHSPWPKGDPNWYADTKVNWVTWFTTTGEGFHDASWRAAYGPGTEANGSHGCVNMPANAAQLVYNWAQTGDPVVIIPGDGSKPADQLKQNSLSPDGSGVPLDSTSVRGA